MTDILEELKHRADLLDQAEQEMDLEPSEKESLFFVRVIAHIRGLMQQAETDQDFIQQYQQQVGALKVERDKLIQAVADHGTVRAEQRAEIERLEALHHSTNRELWSALDRMEDAKQERDALRSQLDRVTWALEHLLERGIAPPDRNCSCHISPPCNDCVEWSGLREAVEHAESALAAVSQPVSQHVPGEQHRVETDTHTIVLGNPPEEPDDWPEDDSRRHNCDVMGCGRAHVLARIRKPPISHAKDVCEYCEYCNGTAADRLRAWMEVSVRAAAKVGEKK